MRRLILYTIAALTFVAAFLMLFFISDVKVVNPNPKDRGILIDNTAEDSRTIEERIGKYLRGGYNNPTSAFTLLVDDIYLSNIDDPLHVIRDYNSNLKKILINGKERDVEINKNNPFTTGKNIQKDQRLYSFEVFRNLDLFNQVTLDLFFDGFLKDTHVKLILDFKLYNFAFLNDNILIYRNTSNNIDRATSFKNELVTNYGQYNWYTFKQPADDRDEKQIIDFQEVDAEKYFLQPYKNVYAYSGDYKKVKYLKVTYNKLENQVLQVQNVEKDNKIPFLPQPTREGYRLVEWKLIDENNKLVEFDPTQKITKDINLLAIWTPISYNIRYDLNNGEVEDFSKLPQKYTINDSFDIPNPRRDGYNFIGWLDEKSIKPEINYQVKEGRTGNILLTARWKAEDINVIFDYADGERDERTQQFAYNQPYTLEKPLRRNYLFIGWKDKKTGQIFNQSGVFNRKEELHLEAVWRENVYTVRFYTDQKEFEKSNIYVDENNKKNEFTSEKQSFIKEPISPVREGYTFLGWFKDGTTRISFPYQSSIDTNIIGLWRINQYILNFYPDGGDWVVNRFTVRNVDEFGPVSYEVKRNYRSIIQLSPTSKKHGYVFKGWFKFNPEDPTDKTETKIDFPYTVKQDENFIAKWEAKQIRIHYDTDGGQMPQEHLDLTDDVSFEKSFDLPIPTKENFIFLGWAPKGEKKVVTIYDLDLDHENHLVAQWRPRTFVVSLITNSESYIADIDKLYGSNLQILEIPTPIKTGYEFSHWMLVENGIETTSLKNVNELLIDENKTLSAKYEILNYNITFDVNKDIIGTDLTELKEVEKDIVFDENTVITYNILNGEDDSSQDEKLHSVNIPNLKFPGYDFLGWSYLSNGFPQKNITIKKRINDIKLYARWRNKNYKLIYNEAHLTDNISESIIGYKERFQLKKSFKKGYTFEAWYTTDVEADQNSTTLFTDELPWEYLEDIVIYPKFKINTYKVHFISDNKPYQINQEDVIYDVEYEKTVDFSTLNLNIPTKTGYDFEGWYEGRTEFTQNSKVTYEMFVTAKFTPKIFRLNYRYWTNSGKSSKYSKIIKYDDFYSLPDLNSDFPSHAYTYEGYSTVTFDTEDDQLPSTYVQPGVWKYEHDLDIWQVRKPRIFKVELDLDGGSFSDKTKQSQGYKDMINEFGTRLEFIPNETNPKKLVFNLKYQEKDVNFSFIDIILNENGGILKRGYSYLGIHDVSTSNKFIINSSSNPKPNEMIITKNNITKDINLIVVYNSKPYKINFDLSNNTDSDYSLSSVSIKSDERYYLPIIVRRNRNDNNINNYIKFVGWNRVLNDGTKTPISDGKFAFDEDITVEPIWEFKDYVVLLDLDGGTLNDQSIEEFNTNYTNENIRYVKEEENGKVTYKIIGKFHSQLSELIIPDKYGYTYTGFKVDGNLINVSSTNKLALGRNGLTYYAYYNPKIVKFVYHNSHDILDYNYNSDKQNGIYYWENRTFDKFYTLRNPSSRKYSFLGWYTEPQPTIKDFPDPEKRVFDGVLKQDVAEIHLYAWVQIRTRQFYITGNGGVDPVTKNPLEPYYSFYYFDTIESPRQQYDNHTTANDLEYNLENPARLPIPYKYGYKFENYYIVRDNTVLVNKTDVNDFISDDSNTDIVRLKVEYSALNFNNVVIDNLYNYDTGVKTPQKLLTNVVSFDKTYTLDGPRRKGYTFIGWDVYRQEQDGSYVENPQNIIETIDTTTSINLKYSYDQNVTFVAKYEIAKYRAYYKPSEIDYSTGKIKTEIPAIFNNVDEYGRNYATFTVFDKLEVSRPLDYKGYYFVNYYIYYGSEGKYINANNTKEFSVGGDFVGASPTFNDITGNIEISLKYEKQLVYFRYKGSEMNPSHTISTPYAKLGQRFDAESVNNEFFGNYPTDTYRIDPNEPNKPQDASEHYSLFGYYSTDYTTETIWSTDETKWGKRLNSSASFDDLYWFNEIDPNVPNDSTIYVDVYRRGKSAYDQINKISYTTSVTVVKKSAEGEVLNTYNITKIYKGQQTYNIVDNLTDAETYEYYQVGSDENNLSSKEKITEQSSFIIDDNNKYIVIYKKPLVYGITYEPAGNFDDVDLKGELGYNLLPTNTTLESKTSLMSYKFVSFKYFYFPLVTNNHPSLLIYPLYWQYRLEGSNEWKYLGSGSVKLDFQENIYLRPYFATLQRNVVIYDKFDDSDVLTFYDSRKVNYRSKYSIARGTYKGYEFDKVELLTDGDNPKSRNPKVFINRDDLFTYENDINVANIYKPIEYEYVFETDGAEYIDENDPSKNINLANNVAKLYYTRYYEFPKFVKKGFRIDSVSLNNKNINLNGKTDLNNYTLYADKPNLIKIFTTIESYRIIYDNPFTSDGNGNSNSNNPSLYNVLKEVALSVPVYKGHTFLGWTDSVNPNDPPKVDYVIKAEALGTIILKSHWQTDKYTIKLIDGEILDPTDPNSTNYVDHFEVEYGTGIPRPIPKDKAGYRFKYWTILKKQVEFPFVVTDDKSRNEWLAIWEPIEYQIIYDTNGGTRSNGYDFRDETYTSGSFKIIEIPTKRNYVFKGWIEEGISQNPELTFIIDTSFHRDVKLVAQWKAETYTAKVILNGGTIEDPTQANIDTVEFDYSSVIESVFKNNVVPTKPNYVFTGWYVDGKLLTLPYVVNDSYLNKKVFVASYELINYSITYDLGGSTDVVGPQFYTLGSIIPIKVPEKTGFRFTHWTLQDEFNHIIRDNIETYIIKQQDFGNIHLIANYDAIEYQATIIYDIPGIDNELKIFNFLYKNQDGSNLLENKNKPGYRFDGWYIDDVLFNNKQYNIAHDSVIRARWVSLNYEVTLVNNVPGKQVTKTSKQLKYDGLYSDPQLEEKGYKVNYYYYMDYNGRELGRVESFPIQVKQDLIIGVKYDLVEFNIYYDVRDGINNPLNDKSKFTIDENITVYPANKFGFKFAGWSISSVDNRQEQKPILNGFDGSLYRTDVILTAHWELINSRVDFETQSSVQIKPQFVKYNTYIQRPQDPEKEGFKFLYWYKDSIYKPFNFDLEKIEGDTILYARYIPKLYISNIIYNEFKLNSLVVEFSKYVDEVVIEPYSYLASIEILKHIKISNNISPLSITLIDYNKMEILFRPTDLTADLFITFEKGMTILRDKKDSVNDIAILEEEFKVNYYIDRFIKTYYSKDIIIDKVDIEGEKYLLVTVKDPNSTITPTMVYDDTQTFNVALVGAVKSLNQYRYKIFLENSSALASAKTITFTITTQTETGPITKQYEYVVEPEEVNK